MGPVIIGLAGGTGSGKTSVARKVRAHFPEERVIIVNHDAYYRDRSDLPPEERERLNYDHPSAFENDLLIDHLRSLLRGEAVELPEYDFDRHERSRGTRRVGPADIVLLEGILVLESETIRSLMDIRIYIDEDADERLIRRLRRDIQERGRTIESVLDQYQRTVRPMHLQFVEPSKRHADLIVPVGAHNEVAIDFIVTKIAEILRRK